MCKKWRRKRLGRLAKLVQVTPGNEFASSDLLSPAAKGGETEPQLSAAACNLIGLDMTRPEPSVSFLMRQDVVAWANLEVDLM